MLRIELPLSEKHLWTTATLESSSFTVTGPPHISVLFNLILPRRHFQAAYFSLRLVPLPAVSVHCLMYRPSPAMKRKKFFLARVERLPVTSRSHVTDRLTDKCKISIMMLLTTRADRLLRSARAHKLYIQHAMLVPPTDLHL